MTLIRMALIPLIPIAHIESYYSLSNIYVENSFISITLCLSEFNKVSIISVSFSKIKECAAGLWE